LEPGLRKTSLKIGCDRKMWDRKNVPFLTGWRKGFVAEFARIQAVTAWSI